MTKRILLLGATTVVLEEARQRLAIPDIELFGGTRADDVRQAFRQADIDHVIIGGGLDLDTRAAMAREVFQSSDKATVHMKDQMSGPEGFLPFARAVLAGLDDYEPGQSPQAILRAQRPNTP